MFNDLQHRRKIFIIDASIYIFKVYYGISLLYYHNNILINAVYGFMCMLINLLNKYNPNYIVIVLDSHYKNFRSKIYNAYKASRTSMPLELITQLNFINEIIKIFNISICIKKGYEADDIIGSIAKQCVSYGYQSIIVTSDKDFMQLIDDNIYLLSNNIIFYNYKKKFITMKDVIYKFGVIPKYVVDILALAGDRSDNIPGIPGVGLMTAMMLVKKYGSLDSIFKHINYIKVNILSKEIVLFINYAYLSKELITINCDVPLLIDINNFKSTNICKIKLLNLCDKFNFLCLKKMYYFQ